MCLQMCYPEKNTLSVWCSGQECINLNPIMRKHQVSALLKKGEGELHPSEVSLTIIKDQDWL